MTQALPNAEVAPELQREVVACCAWCLRLDCSGVHRECSPPPRTADPDAAGALAGAICCCDRPMPLEDGLCLKCGRPVPGADHG